MSEREDDAPIGDLSDAERAWDRRLAAAGHSALGWRMLGRDENGHLVAAATVPCGPGSAHERYCTATLTPAGLVYATLRRPRTSPPSPP